MTDSVPVSPAAQAVETKPPELWWSPTCGLFGYVDGMGTGDSIGPLHARADDAVRLVPAPGPDTEVDDEKSPAAGPERITISLDTLWSCILVGVSGIDGAVPPTRRINAAVRLAHRAAARDEAAGVRTDGETPR